MGLRAVGEVPANFRAWVKRPECRSMQAGHAARRVDHLVRHSPAFTGEDWRMCKVKEGTRGPVLWRYRAARVHMTRQDRQANRTVPTDRRYWLIVMENPATQEIKYVVSNAPESVSPQTCIRVLLSRWHIEKWFERAKQDAGLGAFEVRTYTSLIRHWLCVRVAMGFLSEQTTRLRKKNHRITFEQVRRFVAPIAEKLWRKDHRSPRSLIKVCLYYQRRNTASYESRRRNAKNAAGP